MTLGQKRRLFTMLLPRLIDHANLIGFTAQIDEVRRSPKVAAEYARLGIGIVNSLHVKGLAVDMDLFERRDGKLVYLTDSDDYKVVGVFWEGLHELCCWGGRFRNRDGRHFSITHGGVK